MAPQKTILKDAPSNSRKASRLAKPPQPKSAVHSKSLKSQKLRKGIFSGKVFVLSGEFEKPHSTIERWIEHLGGRVEKKVTSETTYLICTMKDFKNKVTHVREAWKLGSTRCKIIDIEFIEDCTAGKKPKLVPVTSSQKSYELKKILSEMQKKRSAPVHLDKSVRGITSSKEVIEPPCHHIYTDITGFQYKVPLNRIIFSLRGRKLGETFTIYLFESNATPPRTYVVAKKYKRTGLPAVLYHDKDVGKDFHTALAEFKSIFEDKTGVKWDQRLTQRGGNSQSYVYRPPTGGKPVGLLPCGWERMDEDVEPEPGARPEPELDSTATSSKEAVDGDCHMVDPDLMDDTDSGDGDS